MRRREFIQTGVASAIAAGCATSDGKMSNAAQMPRRAYGAKGIKLSIIGFGGIVVKGAEQDRANRVVAEAFERGVNYFDVAPGYGDAEIKLGPALEPYRKKIFLACKTHNRDKRRASIDLKRSLARLRTDYFDLYQLHAITDVEKDVDAVFAKGGAMEVFTEARRSGQVRHLGFSAHSIEAAMTAMDRYDFDSILFPVNFASFYENDFGPQVIKRAQEKGVARLALKAMARQMWQPEDPRRADFKNTWYEPLTEPHEALLGLRFTLSKPVTAAIPPGDEGLFRLAMDLAPDIKPITPQEETELRRVAQTLEPIFPRPARA